MVLILFHIVRIVIGRRGSGGGREERGREEGEGREEEVGEEEEEVGVEEEEEGVEEGAYIQCKCGGNRACSVLGRLTPVVYQARLRPGGGA